MAAAGALRTAVAGALEGLAAGVRPTYARANKPYRRSKVWPGVGASSHRRFYFLPPKALEESSAGAGSLYLNGSFLLHVALNLAGLDLDERFDAIEQEGLLILRTVKTTAHPAGIRWHNARGWDYTREDEQLEDVTLELTVQYEAAETA